MVRRNLHFIEILNAIIDDGQEAARIDYTRPDQKLKLEGSLRGFEECRSKTPPEIAALLVEAGRDRLAAYEKEAPDYWYWRCREAEIEWVANVVSCVLSMNNMEPIATMTLRGIRKAMDIFGIERPDGT